MTIGGGSARQPNLHLEFRPGLMGRPASLGDPASGGINWEGDRRAIVGGRSLTLAEEEGFRKILMRIRELLRRRLQHRYFGNRESFVGERRRKKKKRRGFWFGLKKI